MSHILLPSWQDVSLLSSLLFKAYLQPKHKELFTFTWSLYQKNGALQIGASKEIACLPPQPGTDDFPFLLLSKVVGQNQCAFIFTDYLDIRCYRNANSEV